MSLNESIVEDAALEWFGGQSRVASPLTPTFCLRPSPLRSGSQRGRAEGRVAIRRLNPANACGSPHLTSPKGRAGVCNRQGILVSSKPIERRLNP